MLPYYHDDPPLTAMALTQNPPSSMLCPTMYKAFRIPISPPHNTASNRKCRYAVDDPSEKIPPRSSSHRSRRLDHRAITILPRSPLALITLSSHRSLPPLQIRLLTIHIIISLRPANFPITARSEHSAKRFPLAPWSPAPSAASPDGEVVHPEAEPAQDDAHERAEEDVEAVVAEIGVPGAGDVDG